MINIIEKESCCGCYGCVNICPYDCISMKIDDEGFWYPIVDHDKCIGCNLCSNICPTINEIKKIEFNVIPYACKSKNDEIQVSSSSGGVFTNLCEYIIKNEGIVFGAAFNDKFEVEHIEASTMKLCEKFKGSKYVQSKIGDTYIKARKYLQEGKLVLFSGTQCQIKGLNLFLRKDYSNLITVDIICHGVPSPLIFKEYKELISKKFNSEIKYIGFREKDKGWKNFSFKVKFENGKEYSNTHREDLYMKGFLNDLYLRPSCYNCTAKDFRNNSDISLADYWGIEEKHLDFYDEKGVSLILINSRKGKLFFKNIEEKISTLDTDLNYAISRNPCIVKPVSYNRKRERFFNEFRRNNLEDTISKFVNVSMTEKIINKLKYIMLKFKY
ncbi:Coenzyme F420 hydrogenase/dehydrogenase, beta subunit C-terminal domain [Romboutsia hominis]|uniref:4Fe-4S binding domain protein n=1 Tax=Romboutsia hominis TaxID=1507512 RepID=A0A2P2BSK3_9FIRM|nr:Coenzyme F420 hydrogenase/dehydrogenase, beta subunit C-terminal domain [Romboutsia hominis]CEI73361.1 4Fe-4S binding domain protein [Romboutsia hominis]